MNNIEMTQYIELRSRIQSFVESYNNTQDELTDELTTWCSLISMVNDYLEAGSVEFVIDTTGTPRVVCFGDVTPERASGLLATALEMLEEDFA